jgi:hypothetical protein
MLTTTKQSLGGSSAAPETQARNRLYSDQDVTCDDFKDIPVINMELYLNAKNRADSSLPDDVKIEC